MSVPLHRTLPGVQTTFKRDLGRPTFWSSLPFAGRTTLCYCMGNEPGDCVPDLEPFVMLTSPSTKDLDPLRPLLEFVSSSTSQAITALDLCSITSATRHLSLIHRPALRPRSTRTLKRPAVALFPSAIGPRLRYSSSIWPWHSVKLLIDLRQSRVLDFSR